MILVCQTDTQHRLLDGVYIYGVSPQKTNKTVNVRIQTDSSPYPKRVIYFDLVKHRILSLKSVSGDPVKIRSDAHQDGNISKRYAEYIINKSTVTADVDVLQIMCCIKDWKQPHDFTDLKSGLIVSSFLSVKAQVNLTDSQERWMLLENDVLL